MIRFAANLTMLFTELPFEERFQAAAENGFSAVEFLFPYDYAPERLSALLKENKLEQVLFNMYPGDWAGGERGIAALPGREEEFAGSITQALEYAEAMGTKTIHMMSGNIDSANRKQHEETWLSNVRKAADACAEKGITLVLEPLNPVDMPGYFYSSQYQCAELIARTERKNIKLQFDFYHAQIVDGNISVMLKELMPVIGHIQIASNPARNEPDTGELNFNHIFGVLAECGYKGWIGCEYKPKHDTVSGLGWVKPWL